MVGNHHRQMLMIDNVQGTASLPSRNRGAMETHSLKSRERQVSLTDGAILSVLQSASIQYLTGRIGVVT